MKTNFIHSDFLLESPLARTLYHEYVEGLPIADYHNHLVPSELASDRRFDDIGQLWVASDPYKHRAMRLHGENESVITGPATTREKFEAWARTLPHTLGNPLFHWSAMEMKNVFGLIGKRSVCIRRRVAPKMRHYVFIEYKMRFECSYPFRNINHAYSPFIPSGTGKRCSVQRLVRYIL